LSQPARVGLTGGIGSGKSTAAAMFSALGVPVLDLDQVGRSLAMPGSLCLRRLVTAFGEEILRADGSLNRMKLASLCFSDADKTARLNAIMHPLIRQEEQAWLSCQQADFAIIEASVLIESGGAERMDAVIAILAEEGLRRRRVLERGLQDAEGFERILSRQCSDTERRRVSDYIITNDGELTELERQVKLIYRQLLARFAAPES